ncbi:nitrate reductase subunit alpha [Aestuariivita boseongensis]|uniref:nitrate reductase subunit alpha n=1 Tax=Aestuariivita boseongensis TaxID=1470562 RepID=UPI000680A2D8|nr:nitrate reductase subunit alpha [Aestuariivita boseongensis]
MSHLLDKLNFFQSKELEQFSDGWGQTTRENRDWEDTYRNRWRHDKIVRSTHGVNCTGSCSWKIYVKSGIVTWETQQTDYPRTRAGLPNHEPRGCARGASYSWYLYSANRVKNPLIRSALMRAWRKMRETMTPVAAWAAIQGDPALRNGINKTRGKGGFVRASWDEATEIIAAANAYTAKTYGPDRVFGFSPIPAMSMVSYAAGSRYLSLLGGTCMSFYDWYCDLPPASPQTWGEQTDVPESADWYNAGFLMLWGSNVPQTRTPDAHFYTEVRYRGTKSAVVSPDYSEAAKFGDIWLNPQAGTDAALAMAMGHVILREFHLDRQAEYFEEYARKYTDMPMLVRLDEKDGHLVPGRMLRADDFDGNLGESNNPDWKTVAYDEASGKIVAPNGSIGFRWGEEGKWNLEEQAKGAETKLRLSQILDEDHDEVVGVDFPYFGGAATGDFVKCDHPEVLTRNIPARRIALADGKEVLVATVFDLFCANYGLDRGLGGEWVSKDFNDDSPYTPAWAEKITGVEREKIIAVAREFAGNAEKTHGKSMVILGAGLNHWYHMDMNYRGIINMLVMCGCIGQEGGGWSHYVGQEKLRPQTGWQPLAFALDWNRPPRHMNSTSCWYAHTDQWRYETLRAGEILSPTAPEGDWDISLIDYNIRAERMGWLPSAPQLKTNPLEVSKAAKKAGKEIKDYVAEQLKSGDLEMSCQDPDAPENWPRNLFVWRSNLLGSSGKGHEYFLKHLLGTDHGVMGKDLGEEGGVMPKEARWHDEAPKGKLDLLVCIDFRMSTTAVYSDIVLPTASWYEKDDLNTSDMHPFIHPLQAAVDPAYESKSDWEIFKSIARKFSEVAPEVLGVETDIVQLPLLHDTAAELAQAHVKDWKKGECDLIPGKTAPNYIAVERDYPNLYKKFTSVGPLLEKLGNGGKGINWDTKTEVKHLRDLNGVVLDEGVSKGQPKLETAIDAAEMILMLAPETNGEVAVKAWEELEKPTGQHHAHLAEGAHHTKIRFRDIAAQPRKIISSPTWSGIESEEVCYNAGYTNVHELIPWRTLTGRQQLYQDHEWMRAFGEGFVSYRPPVDLKTITAAVNNDAAEGSPHVVLNFITPHQKWGIHSTYTDNLLMLTLNRGGPVVWMSEVDAKKAGLVDNDWVEAYNTNGALTARVVVSQRIKQGTLFMYHAQEKIVNTPGSEKTGNRGGIHNSVTRATLKPTHMIGGYAQLSYGFNYYGTVGSNRDEFVIVRKMKKIDWLDKPASRSATQNVEAAE